MCVLKKILTFVLPASVSNIDHRFNVLQPAAAPSSRDCLIEFSVSQHGKNEKLYKGKYIYKIAKPGLARLFYLSRPIAFACDVRIK